MTSSPEVVGLPRASSPLDGFRGEFSRTRTGLLYRCGLAIVAFAMVLLPLVYLGLIAFTAWVVALHLRYDAWLFEGGSGGVLFRLILYFGPAVAGGILVFFMVKPFFAARAKAPELISLDPAREPLLFGFVRKICGLVGAPAPCRIDVDCQVNASASLRRGLWSKDLVLTIGLPLASGLDMRQFAGVLAHEFGHFAQGAGLRLTYIIRRINFWFARVVYERDAWDVRLEEGARGADWRIGLVLHAARGCVWVTRRVLWALMHAGHAISCFMLREMEYDADSYEAKLSGSDAFESTAARLRVLNVAAEVAYQDIRQSWASHRLPENLPLLIDHKASILPGEIRQELSASAASGSTGWFDTHPCDADRVRAVRRRREPGVFRLTEPAANLFSDFSALSRAVTRHQYEKHFGLDLTDQDLMSPEEIVRESASNSEAEAMVRQYYGAVNISLRPLLTVGLLPPLGNVGELAANWRKARKAVESLRAEAEKVSADCLEQQRRLVRLVSAWHLAKAGFKLEPQEFGFPPTATSPDKQEIAARFAIEDTSAALSEGLAKVEPFLAALRQRVTLALRFARMTPDPSNPEPAKEAAELVRLLAAVGAEAPRAQEIGSKLAAWALLVQNRPNHSDPAEVDRIISRIASELQTVIGGIQERLQQFAYPFPHARGHLTVAEYARCERPSENQYQRIYLDAGAHVDRLLALHYKLTGRVLALGAAAEKELEAQEESNAPSRG